MEVRREQIPAHMLEGYRSKGGFDEYPNRLSVYTEPFETSHPYHQDIPGLAAFADYFVGDNGIDLAFIHVDPIMRDQGIARSLLEELYQMYPDKRFYWGKIMDDKIEHLKKDFRERFPQRTANIFDPVQDSLDQKVFSGIEPRPTTLSFVHDHLSKTLERGLGFNALEFIDLYLTGSLTTYQWSETSDLDISLFVQWDMWPLQEEPRQIRRELIRIMVDKADGIFLPGTQHPIQHFVVPPETMPEDLYKPGLRSAYDFQTNRWVVPPERERVHNVQVELPILYHRAQLMAEKMEQLLDYNPIYAKEFWHQIHRKRTLDHQEGLGDFSEGNIVYKYLLHNGYFDRIRSELGEYIARVTPNGGTNRMTPLGGRPDAGFEDWVCLECGAHGRDEVYEDPEGGFECRRCGMAIVSSWRLADSMRWDNLDDIPAGGMMDAPSNENPEGIVRHTPWQQGPGECPYHGTPLEIVRIYNDGSTYYSCLACQRADKEEWAESRRPLAASDYLDQSLKVIYDFENDKIILGTKSEAALMPTGKIVGEYTEEDVILYDHHEAWLNSEYFKKLWGHSFPDRPLRSVFIESDGEHHRISATLEDHGTEAPHPEAPEARVGLEEGRAEGDEEEQEGVEVLPLGWRFGMPEQFGAFWWPTVDEVFEASEHVVSETGQSHQGWRPGADNAIGGAIGSAINQHVYGEVSDPIQLAANLIWRIQATQAAIDGNKRTGTVTGLAWLETQGYDTEPIPTDDSLFRVVDQASQMEPGDGENLIAEYLRKYVVKEERPDYPEEWTDD